MNYFKNQKMLVWAVAILVLINLFSLSALFIQHKKIADFRMMDDRSNKLPPLKFDRMEHFMKNEIGFTEAQIDSFRITRKAHAEAMQQLNMEVHKKKKQLMDGAFDDGLDYEETQKLISEIGGLQTKIEEISQKHLLELSRLCQPDQKKKLKKLVEEAMVRHRPNFQENDRRPNHHKAKMKEHRVRKHFNPDR